MTVVFDEHDVAVWQGDALEQLTLMPAGSVQLELNPDYIDMIRARIGQAPLEFADDAAPVITELAAVQDLLDIGDVAP